MVSEEEEKSGDDGGDSCRRSVEGVKRSRGGKADLSFVNVFTCRTTFFFFFSLQCPTTDVLCSHS